MLHGYWIIRGLTHLILHPLTVTQPLISMSLLSALSFASLAAEAAQMPDSLVSEAELASIAGGASASLSVSQEGLIDFSALSHSPFDTLELDCAGAQRLYNVDPASVYQLTGEAHTLSVTGTEADEVTLAAADGFVWSTPELSSDGSHYTSISVGDFDHNAATPDDTVTLNIARTICDDTLAYDSQAVNDGGLGDDTLTFGDSASTVDFSEGAAHNILNIEHFDLCAGDHSLENLTAKDVFDMTDARHTITVTGDSGDKVSLADVLNDSSDGIWESCPVHSVENGVGYEVYSGSFNGQLVTLKIEDEIIQQLNGTQHIK